VVGFLRSLGILHHVRVTREVRVGLLAGLIATAAYDVSRLIAWAVIGSATHPFEAWRFFGIGLVGAGAPGPLHWIVGGLFHLINGLAFAIAYTIWFGRSGIVAGVAWALFLEAFMLGLYPGWLHLKAYEPFLVVSLVGHLAYGATLGAIARRLLLRGDGA
jgi:hypothetical protein